MSRPTIVLNLPSHWSETSVMALAERLASDELPQSVGVDVDMPGRFMEKVLREVSDDE